MEILGKLGIDIYLLIAQIINFIFLLFILNKFVYQPILKNIKEEENRAKQKEKDLNQKQQELEKKISETTKKIKNSKKRADNIISEAEQLAKKMKQKTQLEIKTEKEKIIAQLKKRL